MKKWLIVTLSCILLFVYGAFLLVYKDRMYPQPQPESTTETTTPVTTATQTTPATEMTTEPTLPRETVMPADYQLTGKHAFVYDCESETLLFTMGDQQEQISPASLTKLFTAYVALQYLEPDALVTAGEETTWIDPASSIASVAPGDTLRVEMLIQGMLMQSGNDAAHAVAVAAGRVIANNPQLSAREALNTFMEEVNRQLAQHKLAGTHFVTPDGLDAPGHHTTPADMLAIAILAAENPTIRHYAGISKSPVKFESGKTLDWLNTNFLLHPESQYYSADACGLKTGSTSKAGSCLLATFYVEDHYMIVGVFGCPTYESRFADALYLYEQYR